MLPWRWTWPHYGKRTPRFDLPLLYHDALTVTRDLFLALTVTRVLFLALTVTRGLFLALTVTRGLF